MRQVHTSITTFIMSQIFHDRSQAGYLLGQRLLQWRDTAVLVLALPRGGVPVAVEVANYVRAPLDTLVVRKLGVPGQEEYAFGAMGPEGEVVIDEETVRKYQLTSEQIDSVRQQADAERVHQETELESGHWSAGTFETIIIVDDGLATGLTAVAAARVARQRYPQARLILAVPVCATDATAKLTAEVDEVVCLEQPEPFFAVGEWYTVFDQVTTGEAYTMLLITNDVREQPPEDYDD